MVGGVPCTNCGREVGVADGKLFAEVLVCSTCGLLAERFYTRLQGDLRSCLLLAKDKIREALATGKFQLAEQQDAAPVGKQELMGAIMELYKRSDDGQRNGNVPAAVSALPAGKTS